MWLISVLFFPVPCTFYPSICHIIHYYLLYPHVWWASFLFLVLPILHIYITYNLGLYYVSLVEFFLGMCFFAKRYVLLNALMDTWLIFYSVIGCCDLQGPIFYLLFMSWFSSSCGITGIYGSSTSDVLHTFGGTFAISFMGVIIGIVLWVSCVCLFGVCWIYWVAHLFDLRFYIFWVCHPQTFFILVTFILRYLSTFYFICHGSKNIH